MAYNESPVENQNKGYAGQEKQDLLNDNPIDKDASGGRDGSWMSKHSQSKIGGGSPLMELTPAQESLDKNNNDKIDGEDFKLMKK